MPYFGKRNQLNNLSATITKILINLSLDDNTQLLTKIKFFKTKYVKEKK